MGLVSKVTGRRVKRILDAKPGNPVIRIEYEGHNGVRIVNRVDLILDPEFTTENEQYLQPYL